MAATPALYVGLISGTSADGVDAALASFDPAIRLHAAVTYAYPNDLRQRILTLAQGPGLIALDEFGVLDVEIARVFAQATQALLQRAGISADAVHALGSHGQTVRHRPDGATPYTLQLGDPSLVAELTGITTVADFRRRDLAAGGQGAPLAPGLHAALCSQPGRTRVVLNLGGIANITILMGTPEAPVGGFDTGPASCLLDAWAQHHLGLAYDREGFFAAGGRIQSGLLERLLSDPYFAAAPPKSTGREVFHLAWLQRHIGTVEFAPADVQATLVALTARSVADAIARHAAGTSEILVCGGGVHNPVLMAALTAKLAPVSVISTQQVGIDPDFMEALLFAWLAWRRLENRPGNLPAVTGARGERVLGGIYFGR